MYLCLVYFLLIVAIFSPVPALPKPAGRSAPTEIRPLVGRAAILEDRGGDNFVGVAFGREHLASSVFVVTESGILCELNQERKIVRWIDTTVRINGVAEVMRPKLHPGV